MHTKNYQPTADHLRWHRWVRERFTICQNCQTANATDLHHILGAAAKHAKQWIGQWAVTMLCYHCNHDDLTLPTKREQLDQFSDDVLQAYVEEEQALPRGMTAEHREAINNWHR